MARGQEHARLFGEALETLGYITVVQSLTTETDKIRLLLRVTDEVPWLKFVEALLRAGIPGDLHICKAYFLKGRNLQNSRMVYGWTAGISSKDMEKSVQSVLSLLTVNRGDERDDVETLSKDIPLVSAGVNRGLYSGDKGARPI